MASVLNPARRGGHSYAALGGRLGEMAYLGLVLFVVFVALICGGGTRQGLLSDALAQIVSLPLLAVAFSRLRFAKQSERRVALLLVGVVVLVPCLQLVPLPPQMWTILPGRAEVAEAYQTAGLSLPFLPISLEPLTTLRSLLSLLPAIAVFLGVLSMREGEIPWLLLLIFFVTLAGSGLALMQMVGGVDSPLRFYDTTNLFRGVGLFANSNHQAAFFYAVIPYAAVWASLSRYTTRDRRIFHQTFSVIVLVAIVVGLPTTVSRFGVLLGLLAGLCSIPLVAGVVPAAERRRILKLAAIATAVALLLAFQFGFVGLADRITETVGGRDLRWSLLSITAKAAKDYFPFGSGIGTFTPVYQRHEPLENLQVVYVNRAHNDWVESWLEGGLVSAAVITVLVASYLFLAYRSWRTTHPNLRLVAYGRAGSICVGLLLIHSISDYPLRTTALMVMVAISVAFMLRIQLVNQRPV